MKRTWWIVVVAAVGVAGCKGDKKSGAGGRGGSKGGCEITASQPAELVTGKSAQLIAPFAALKLGMPLAEVKQACPNFFEDKDDAAKTGTFSVGEVVGRFGEALAYGRLDFQDSKLELVMLQLPPAIADALTAAWGAPQASAGAQPAQAWLDPATGVRAILAPVEDGTRELVYSTFVPLEAFVELDTARLAIKPQDVLGKTSKELLEKFPAFVHPEHHDEATDKLTEAMMADMKKQVEELGVDTTPRPDAVEVRLPATPFAAGIATSAIFHHNDDGTVRNYEVWFRTQGLGSDAPGWPAEITELVKLFETKWGASKKIARTLGEETTWYDVKTHVRAAAQVDPSKPDELDVSYVRYLPLSEFFGAPGPAWGFEKPERPLLGATPDELVAAYGKAIELNKDGTTATLSLPPTDYDDDVAETRILMFIRSGKVGQWNVSIDFDQYPPAKAEYEALLAAKLGPPKPAKYDHVIYSKKPLVDVHFSDITHAMDLEVTGK